MEENKQMKKKKGGGGGIWLCMVHFLANYPLWDKLTKAKKKMQI